MINTTEFSPIRNIDLAADRAHRAVDRAKEKAAPMLQSAATTAHRAIDKVATATAPAAQWVSENGRRLETKSAQLADVCSDRVRARPLVSVAAALAFGYFLGKFLQR